MEKEVVASVNKLSKETQADLLENESIQSDVNVLKNHCVGIKKSLNEQTEKIDLVIRKLEKEEQLFPEEPTKLKQEIKNAETDTKDALEVNLDTNKELQHNLQSNIQNGNLKSEVEHLKIQILELNKKNDQLQNDIREIEKLKEEVNKLNQQLGNDGQPTPFYFIGAPIDVKDSLVKNLEKENLNLRTEIETLQNTVEPSVDMTDDSSLQNENYSPNYTYQPRGRQASRVSFAVTTDRLESEVSELQRENSELKLKIKQFQGVNENEDELERLTVELVNLRKQLKQKEEEIDKLKHEVEAITSRKRTIIQELQDTNSLLKSDYEELLDINNKLMHDLRTANFQKNPSCKEVETNTEETYSEIKSESRYGNAELAAINRNNNTTNIIKEAVVESLYSEMEKLKATLCDRTECEKVIEENRKITNELNTKSKQLETISDELQTKENTIKNSVGEIDQLKKLINEKNEALKQRDGIVNELSNKIRECDSTRKVQELQTSINILKSKLAEALEDNHNNEKDIQLHRQCACKITKLEADLSVLREENGKLTNENENLNIKVNIMKNAVRQYREEAEFKKLENEKLRKKEEHLESAISSVRRNSENIAREYHKEVENNKLALTQISKERDSIKSDFQTQLDQINEENAEFKKVLQQKDKEITEATNRMNESVKELEDIKVLHKKHLNSCDRSMCEIKYLFKNKEDELIEAVHELQEYKENLKHSVEENGRIKKLLQTNIQQNENREYGLILEQTVKLRTFEGELNNEKMKNSELERVLSNIHKDVQNLKAQLQDLLKNLQSKLNLLKNDLSKNNCDESVSKKSVNDMLECIEKFRQNVLQQQFPANHCAKNSSEETENYSYYYDETSRGTIVQGNGCVTETCPKNNLQNRDTNADRTKNVSSSNQNVSCTAVRDLQIKREYLVQKLSSIDEELKNACYPSIIKILGPQQLTSSTTVINSLPRYSDEESYETCSQQSDIELRPDIINCTKPNQAHDDATIASNCSSATCASRESNLEVGQNLATNLQKMDTDSAEAKDSVCDGPAGENSCSSVLCTHRNYSKTLLTESYKTKIDSQTCKEDSATISEDESSVQCNFRKCPYSGSLETCYNRSSCSSGTCSSYGSKSANVEQMTANLYAIRESATETSEESVYQAPMDISSEVPTTVDQPAVDETLPKLGNLEETVNSKIITPNDQDDHVADVNNIDKTKDSTEKARDDSACPGCPTQVTASMISVPDTFTSKPCNVLKEINHNLNENASKPSCMQNKKRISSTGIPIPLQSSQRKIKEIGSFTSSKSSLKAKERQNRHNVNVNINNKSCTASKSSAEVKGVPQSSCSCIKTSSYIGTSHLPNTSNLNKKYLCTCTCVKKENNALVTKDIHSGNKTCSQCKCKDASKNMKN